MTIFYLQSGSFVFTLWAWKWSYLWNFGTKISPDPHYGRRGGSHMPKDYYLANSHFKQSERSRSWQHLHLLSRPMVSMFVLSEDLRPWRTCKYVLMGKSLDQIGSAFWISDQVTMKALNWKEFFGSGLTWNQIFGHEICINKFLKLQMKLLRTTRGSTVCPVSSDPQGKLLNIFASENEVYTIF